MYLAHYVYRPEPGRRKETFPHYFVIWGATMLQMGREVYCIEKTADNLMHKKDSDLYDEYLELLQYLKQY